MEPAGNTYSRWRTPGADRSTGAVASVRGGGGSVVDVEQAARSTTRTAVTALRTLT